MDEKQAVPAVIAELAEIETDWDALCGEAAEA